MRVLQLHQSHRIQPLKGKRTMAIAEAHDIYVGRGAGRVTIAVRGPLDPPRVPALLKAASAVMEPGMDLIVDLVEATLLGPEGAQALSTIRATVHQSDGTFQLRRPAADIGEASRMAELGAASPAGRVSATAMDRARLHHPAGRARWTR